MARAGDYTDEPYELPDGTRIGVPPGKLHSSSSSPGARFVREGARRAFVTGRSIVSRHDDEEEEREDRQELHDDSRGKHEGRGDSYPESRASVGPPCRRRGGGRAGGCMLPVALLARIMRVDR